jgi:hypothetical protein
MQWGEWEGGESGLIISGSGVSSVSGVVTVVAVPMGLVYNEACKEFVLVQSIE